MGTHILTAAELRARGVAVGTVADAKDALAGWQCKQNDILNEAKNEGRELKADERRALRKAIDESQSLGELIEECQPQYKRDMGDGERRGDGEGAGDFGPSGLPPELAGKDVATPEQWARKAAHGLTTAGRASGRKAVVSGSLDLPSVIVDTVADPQGAKRLLELIPTKPIGENNYGYVKQTVRTNNAAPVADHGTKPTSVFTFEEVEDRARVIAHLSEPIPMRYFEDHEEIVRLLKSEMAYGLLSATEAQVLSGDGIGENFTGILETVGTTAVAFDTDEATTLRHARSALAGLEEDPTAYVIHPDDYEAVELGADPNLDLKRIFGPLPVVQSVATPVGTALLADWRLTRLYVRERARLDMDAGGALFDKNEVKLRSEQRANFVALRPQAIAVIDLTAV